MTVTIKGLAPKTAGTFFVVAVYEPTAGGEQIRSAKPVKVKAKTAALAAPKLAKAATGDITATSITLRWKPVAGADAFIVMCMQQKNKIALYYGLGGNASFIYDNGKIVGVTITGLTAGTKYNFTIQGVNTTLNARSAITKKTVTTLKTPLVKTATPSQAVASSALLSLEPLTLLKDVAAFGNSGVL